MADKVAIGRFTTPGSTGNTDWTTTDLGGVTPTACVIFQSNASAEATATDDVIYGVGFSDGTSDVSANTVAEDAITGGDTSIVSSTSQVVNQFLPDASAAGDVDATINSFISNGIRINFTDLPATAQMYTVIFFAGTANVHVGTVALSTSAVDVTAPGFQPDLVLGALTWADAPNSYPSNVSTVSFGAATSSSQACIANGVDETNPSESHTYTSNEDIGIIHTGQFGPPTDATVRISAFDANGFTLTPSGADILDGEFHYLAIEFTGASAWVGTFDSPTTAASNWSVTSPGFLPQMVFLGLTTATAYNTWEDGTNSGGHAFSTFTADAEFSQSFRYDDNVATHDNTVRSDDQAVYLMNDAGTAIHIHDYVSMDTNGWTTNPSTANGTARKWMGVAIQEPNVSLTATKGVLGIVGKAATVTATATSAVTGGKGVLAVVGKATTVTAQTNIAESATKGVLAVTGKAATVVANTNVAETATKGVLAVTGKAATATATSNIALTATKGVLGLVGKATTVVAGVSAINSATKGVLAVVGKAATITAEQTVSLTATKGVLGLVGKPTTFEGTTGVNLSATKGVLGLVGKTANVSTYMDAAATKGVLAVAGKTASVSTLVAVAANKGALAVVGKPATVFVDAASNVSLSAENAMPLEIRGKQATITTGLGISALSDAAFSEANYRHGPYERGNGKYTVALEDSAKRDIVVVKSTLATPTDGSWSVQDNAVHLRESSEVRSLWSEPIGEFLHVVTQQVNGSVRYHRFNTATDIWTIRDETVISAGDTNFDNAPANPAVSFAVRSDGDVILVAAYNDGTHERLRLLIRSTTWTNFFAADGEAASTDYTGVIVCGADTNDRVTWFYKNATDNSIKAASLSSSDVLSNEAQLDPTCNTSPPYVCCPGVMVGDRVHAGYIDADFQLTNRNFVAAATIGTVEFDDDITDTGVYGRGRSTAPWVVATLVKSDTDVHCLYARHNDQDLYHVDDATVDNGGTESEIENAVTCTRISAYHGVNDIHYIYTDGNDNPIYGSINTGHMLLDAAKGALAVTGHQATVSASAITNVNITSPGKGVLAVVGKQAAVIGNSVVTAGKGVLALTGRPATVDLGSSTNVSLAATKGVLAITGRPVTFATNVYTFPGAMGFGRDCVGGRGASNSNVYRVTNLNGSGTGSLRNACENGGTRTVIFEVSGEIDLTNSGDIEINDDNITIAGETAPSPGITVRGASLRIFANNVYVSHIRFRVGDDPSGPSAQSRDGISIIASNDVMIDHCSLSWSIDGLLDFNSACRRVTISNCLLAEPLFNSIHPNGDHALAMLCADNAGNAVSKSDGITVLCNGFVNYDFRSPMMKGNSHVAVVNNVLYNGVDNHIFLLDDDGDGPQQAAIVGNVVIPGPVSEFDFNFAATTKSSVDSGSEVYVSGNFSFNGGLFDNQASSGIEVNEAGNQVDISNVTILTADADIRSHVIDNCGARPLDRDAVDTRVTGYIPTTGFAGTQGGLVDSQDDVGGWPTLAENTVSHTLPANQDQDSGDGYTNLEKWIHQFAQALEVNPTNATITAGKGVLAVAGKTATASGNLNLNLSNVGKGVLGVVGRKATVLDDASVAITANRGTLAISGKAASVGLSKALTAGKGALEVEGKQATVSSIFPVTLTAGKGVLAVSGKKATFNPGLTQETWTDLTDDLSDTTETWSDVA